MAQLLYPEFSYTIVGVLFEVHKRLGGQFEEKYYQRAVERIFLKKHIPFVKELKVDISFEGNKIGKYFLDFLVYDKIVLELKTVPVLLPIHFRQVRSYLKVKDLELGILANFRGEQVHYKRILHDIRIN